MAIRSSRGSSFGSWKQHRQVRVKRKRAAKREFLLEKLEDRTLLAIVGPQLAGIQPTDGDLLALDGSSVRSIAPRELTFRFDENQQIDPNTLNGVRIVRSGLDGDFANGVVEVTPGYIGVGAAPNQNEVIVRLAENLPDDLYRIELYGIDDALRGIIALRNLRGEAFGDLTDDKVDNGANRVVGFSLELAPQVLAVVPQPITRAPNPANPSNTILQQSRDQIVVYFNDDDLFIEDDATGNPTQRSAENPQFYRLIFTHDSVENTDDITFFPTSVQYDPAADTATLTFAGDLDTLPVPPGHADAGLPIGPGTWRLRVGTDEALPLPPLTVRPAIEATSDFGTGGAVSVSFAATSDFGKAVTLSFSDAALGAGVAPQVSVAGNAIQVVLNTANAGTTANELVAALNGNPAANRLIGTAISGGDGTTPLVGGGARSLRVLGLGSSYETSYELGQLGAQSLLVASSIDPQSFALDLPGGQDEPGHRDIPTEVGSGFEQHINPNFGPDVQDGVTTILYNFRQVYGFDAQGNPLSNLITEKQKTRVREAVELWAKHLGIQFLETADQGLTFVTGDPRALDPNDPNVMNHALPTGFGFSDYDFIVRIDPSYANGMIILDSARQWNSDYGADWFQRIMVGLGGMLGLQRANDLPVTNLMAFDSSESFVNTAGDNFGNVYFSNRSDRSDSAGSTYVSYSGDGFDSAPTSLFGSRPSEPVFPGNADIIHGQYIHRPDSNDIDLYRFTIDLNDQQLDEKKKGLLTAESFAERLPNSSELDTVLSLYREVEVRDANGAVVGYERELISRNDNYYSSDSYVSLELGSGTYYLGVSAAGNTDFDPVIEDTGSGGTTQGAYELRLNFRSQVDDDDTISDLDRSDENRPGTRLDGDADGTPGGVYNFWFQTRPLDRVLRVTGDGNTYVDGQSVTIEDAFGNVRRFEFDSNGSLANPSATRIPFTTGIVPSTDIDIANQLYNAINSSGLAVTATQTGTAITLQEERVTLLSSTAVGVELAGKTIFVDKISGTNLHGTLAKPFDNISTAFASAVPGDLVRIVGNGGFDGDRATLGDNFAYEIGFGASGGPATLTDGSSMSVPQSVTAMLDAGAVFKLRRARIGVGSSSAGVDRSAGSLQVLGTPRESVYFTSWMDETIGRDTYAPTTTPSAGDWGGILFKADLDNADARFNYEREGVFLNYVSHADIRYGGGQVRIDTVDQVVNPIQMIEMRPTITFNRITYSADAAVSADTNSFEETNFLAPQYQLVNQFTPDYERIGPEIHGNNLLQNSINGLFVRIQTPAGTELRALTVPGRFDDIDIVHVLAENLKIQGEPGGALLETARPPVELVTLAARVGGSLGPPNSSVTHKYTYKLVFVDRNGFEGRPSEATGSVDLPFGSGTVQLSGLPPVSGNFVSRRLYRSQADGGGPYNMIAELDATDATYVDRGAVLPSRTISLLERDPPAVGSTTSTPRETAPTVPGLAAGMYNYRVVVVAANGETSPASDPTSGVTVAAAASPLDVVVVDLAGLPAIPAGAKLQVFRSSVGGGGTYVLVDEIDTGTTFTDDGTVATGADGDPITLDPRLTGVVRARPDGRLKIDPGTVVKLEGARIEITFGAQLIAEGLDDRKIIFTSKLDDKYGAGGTFDTNKDDGPNEASPSRGDWGGIYAGPMGQLNLDQVYLAFGGGNNNKIEGTFTGFNAIEIYQADARIANSVIEQNALGTGGQGSAHRFGRGVNAGATLVSGVRYDSGATIFVRGAQPVILNNIIRNNEDVALSVNLDAFTNELLSDPGRATGQIDQVTLYRDNRGPLVRGNRLADNGNQIDENGNLVQNNNGNLLPDWRGTNGMEIRTAAVWNAGTPADPRDDTLRPVGITLSTESVWDDTDIVHILYDEVRVSNLHVEGGLRLQSSPNESLVVKLAGPGVLNDAYNRNPTIGAGFTATGQTSDTSDRIGGTLYVLGQPGFPVVLTSIHDDTVGAGVRPDGQPQKDANNNRSRSTPQPGDWRSVRLDQNSHDRNVEIVLELSVPEETAPGLNGIPDRAQFLGDLAPDEVSGDDNLRLGFEIHGFLNDPNDVDYYSFTAEGGTEIWFDIDRTRYGLDTVFELLDADGVLIAQSDNSQDETADASLLYQTDAISAGDVNPLQKLNDRYQPHHASGLPKDIWGTNSLDAGLRVVLPGAHGERSPYLFRIRSSSRAAGDPAARLLDPEQLDGGLTTGVYRLQVRMREADEVPGSTVRYADIRYAQNGVELIGLPKHSPLLGEAAEDESTDGVLANNNSFNVSASTPGNRPQELGNLLATDQATLSVAGALSGFGDIDFYTFDVTYENISNPSAHHTSLVFDLDYADGLSRANSTVTVFDSAGRPVLIGRDSNIAEDRPAPVVNPLDQSGMYDLSRGTVGELDPFIGSVEMPQGTYYVAVTSDYLLPDELLNNPDVRLEPVNSTVRIAEDRIGSFGGSTAADPVVPVLLDPAFNGTSLSPANLWHVSNLEAASGGHGLTPAFDGSRLGATGSGTAGKIEPNDTLPSAQSLEGYLWSLNASPDIGDYFGNTSTTIPHLSVSATGNDSFDYYSFVVSSVPARGIFDIDYGVTGDLQTDIDTELFLFDSAGNLLWLNDDASTSYGAGGSTSALDAYMEYTFTTPGTYIVGVGAFSSTGQTGGITGQPVGNGTTYELQFSVEGHPSVTTAGQGGPTFYFGREGTGTYGLGGGSVAGGSLTSHGFSLQDYSAQDLPVLYFNYQLDADTGDHFRVYVQRRDGSEQLVASSNPGEVTATVVGLTNRLNTTVPRVWRQARIDLGSFAGQDLLKLRYEFAAADAAVPTARTGVHIDDVIIGFAERGEMITEASANPAFAQRPGYNVTGRQLTGAYQLELRRATDYGTSIEAGVGFATVPALILNETYDTNDRQTQQMTIVVPPGTALTDGQTFLLGDGSGALTFEFDLVTNGVIQAGHVRVPFRATDPDYVIAAAIRDAVNSPSVQSQLDLQAGLSDGANSGSNGRSNLINLFGNAVADFAVRPVNTVLTVEKPSTTSATALGNLLRDQLLGAGFTPTGAAAFVGGVNASDGTFTSAGLFSGGLSSLGVASGIVLSTGEAVTAGGPNTANASSGDASLSGDADLDNEFFPLEPAARKTKDSTSLQFPVLADFSGTAYFNFVFASEEYNELVGTSSQADALGVFVTDLTAGGTARNVALIPGTTTRVSRTTVNGGNPYGTGATNPGLHNNNDLREGGVFLRELGYDGFTDVFTAQFAVVAGHEYQVKFAIADAGDRLVDSAVFIEAGTLGSVNPAPAPVGLVGILHDGYGDSNHFRDQGQTLIHSNTIKNSADFAIVADAGVRDIDSRDSAFFFFSPTGYTPRLGQSHIGPARNLLELNNRTGTGAAGGMTPGATIVNNTISGEGLGGIHFSGDLRPYELVPNDNVAGELVCDGDAFSITVGRTTVEFEFEDLSDHSAVGACPANSMHGDGWTPGRVPIYYLMESETPNTYIIASQTDLAEAIADAVTRSILVDNGTTQVAEANVGLSRAVGGYWAAYVDHARDVTVLTPHSPFATPPRVTPIGQAAQPFGRIVNNTIVGNDGNAGFFPDAVSEPNDTIFNAVDTRQGRQASPEMFTANNVRLGDSASFLQNPERDVDFYQFQMEIGDHVQVTITGDEFLPQWRLFNERGEEFIADGSGTAQGVPRVTPSATIPNQYTIDFYVADPAASQSGYNYARESGTYFVAVSGPDNDSYSPLSLGSRETPSDIGTYAISVNVLAPRKWLIDTQPLFGATVSWEVTDVDGNTQTVNYTGTSDRRENTPLIANDVRNAFRALSLRGITAEDFGGPEFPHPAGINYTPAFSGPRDQWPGGQRNQGDGRRYVEVYGAAKIVRLSGPTAALSPIVGQNNVDSQLLRETGVLVSEEATPTLLNNVLSNLRNAVVETENQPQSQQTTGVSPRTAIVGAQLFQHSTPFNGSQTAAEMSNWSYSLGRLQTGSLINPEERLVARQDDADFNLPLANTAPLFVNAGARNFFPSPLTAAIDSSVDSLEDRPQFITVKAAMGLSNSPILAPARDVTGQLRVDDPNVSPPQGQGANVFKDRGSLDRSDFIGPAAVLLNPRDDDADGNDIDPTDTVVQLTGGTYDHFLIQIEDGFESADPFPGVGVNDATVLGPNGPEGRLPGAAVTVFADGVFLEEGIDYTYRYDATRNTIRLTPTSGVWASDKVYVVRLNNRDRYVINAPTGSPDLDGTFFDISDDAGIRVRFEYDSGYTIQVPHSLAIQVPVAGLADGQRFVIRDASDPTNLPVIFELDVNDYILPGNFPVPFVLGSSQDEIAAAIVAALRSPEAVAAGLLLEAKNVGGGRVHLGAPERYTLNTEPSNLSQPATILSLAVPAVAGNPSAADVFDTQTFTVTYTPAAGPATTVRFEFDTDVFPNVTPGNTRVAIPAGPIPATPDFVADQIVTALLGTPLAGLLQGLQHVGGGVIHIHQGDEVAIDPEASRLYDGYVSQPVSDSAAAPEVFVVSFDSDANPATPPIQVSFELDRDGTTQPGNVVIPFSYGDTHEEIGQKIATAIATALALDLPDAKQLEDGLVFLGGTIQHNVDLSNSPSLLLRSQPFVTPTTRLLLPSVLTIAVPAAGGAAIADGHVFQIFDNSLSPAERLLQFEFNSAGGATDPASDQLITFSPLDTADTIAQAIKTAIENLVLPGYNAGDVLRPTLSPGGIVQLAGANGYHSLDTARAPSLIPSGGRLVDGETFSIEYNGVIRVFEYDSNGVVSSPTNVPILFTLTSDNDQIGAGTVAAITSQPLLGLPNVQYVGRGVIELYDTSRHITALPVDTFPAQDSLSLTGIPGGAIRLPFEPWSQFTGADFAEVIVDAINNSPLTNTQASLRGGNTLFVDFLTAANQPVDYVSGLTSITGVSNYFLRAIQDLPGNWLKANQYTGETRFTIIMPGAELDFGDARVPNRPSQYPTLFEEDGARHVVAEGWYLGHRVDGEFQGQIVPGGFGDDTDQLVDLRDSTLTLAGNAPLTVQLPDVANPDVALDAKYFDLNSRGGSTRFVFDRGRNGIVDPLRDDNGVTGVLAVDYDAGATLAQIADSLVAAVEAANVGLTPAHLGAGTVFLGGTQLQRIETTSNYVTVAGLAPYQITAAAGYQIDDGDTLTIADGLDVVPWIFEFDHDGTVAAGNFAVSLLPGDEAPTVAQKLRSAVLAAQRLLPSIHIPAVTLTDLGDGRLHVLGALSHTIHFQDSTLAYAGQTPNTLTVPAAGLGFELAPSLTLLVRKVAGGGVGDGQVFTLRDAVNTVVFEFDTNGSLLTSGARPVTMNALSSASVVAESIRAAIQLAVDQDALVGVAPVVDTASDAGYVLIDLQAGIEHSLDASASGLLQRTSVQDGQTFWVDDGANRVTFEFDLDSPPNLGTVGTVGVAIQLSFSANDIANAMVAALAQLIASPGGLSETAGLVPKNLGSGNIQIGGPGDVNAGSTLALHAFGVAGGVLDGHTFHLIDSLGVRRFEFDANGQATQGNILVPFQVNSTGADIAAAMVTVIRGSSYAVNVVHLGGGVIALDGDDEDGVRFDRVLTPGGQVPITVTASHDGFLDGWLDLNGDGDWDDQYEHIFDRIPVQAGANQLTFWIPPGTGPGVTYARFRFGSEGGLAPTGLAIDGEVEDYRVEIISNDPPAILAPAQLATEEDVPLSISGLQIVDPDAGSATFEVTLEVLHGRLAVWPTFLPGGITGNGSSRVVLRGSLAQINNTLAQPNGLVYVNNPLHYNGADRLTVVADDLGSSGTGGPQQAVALVSITVGPLNDAPVVSVPGTQTATEDLPLLIAGISLADVDIGEITSAGSGTGRITVMLSAQRGTLDVAQAAALTVTVTNDQTSLVTLDGSLTDVNSMLAAGVTYLGLSNLNGNDIVTVTADDLGNWPEPAQTASAAFTVAVTPVNDPPAITAPVSVMADEDTELPLSEFNLTDVDSAATPITVTLTVTGRNDGQLPNGILTIKPVAGGVDPTGAQVTGNATPLVTITAPVSQIAATLSNANGWAYMPPGNFAGNVASPKYELLNITANDGGATGVTSPDGTTDMRQVTLFVHEVNDPPVVSVPAAPASVLEDQVLDIRSLGDLEITDADAGNAVISVQLSVGHGTLTLNDLVPAAPAIVGNGTSQVSLSGTLVAINALLDSYVRYQGTLNWNGTELLTILANDLGNTGGPAASGVGRVTIAVAPENDAPQISLPSDLSVNEDTDLRIPAIVLADPDATEGGADGVITVTLSVSPIAPNAQTGTLTVNPAVVPALSVTGSPGSNLTVRGRLTDINTMLAHPDGLKYRGALNGSGQVVFSVTANDEGKSPGPPRTTMASLTITVRPVNDASEITVPLGTQSAVEDQPKLITGISVADVDISEMTSDPPGTGTGQITVTLSADHGTLDVDQAVAPSVTVTNDASQSVTLSGPLSAINTLLGAGTTYRGLPYFNGPDTVTVTANDLGNWPPPARISTATIAVAVDKVNNPPVIAVPGAQFLNEDPAPAQPYYINGIAVTDVDVNEGTGELKVDLRVSHGTLTLDLTIAGGLRATNVTGNGTGLVTVDKAGPNQINATLAALTGLKYQPTLHYNGPDLLVITADDKGNSGGSVPPTTATVPITVVAVNDAPQLPWAVSPGIPPASSTAEDTANHLVWPANAVIDVDVDEMPGDGRLSVTLSASHGVLTISTDFGLLLSDFGGSNTGSTVQFTAPLATINATLSAATGVRYMPNPNYNGKDTVVMTVNDRGNTDAGLVTPLAAEGTVTVTVAAVNDPPVLSVPATSVTVDEDTTIPLQVQVVDADAAEGAGELRMTLQVLFGTLTVNTSLSGGVSAANVIGNGGKAVSLVGTQQQLNTTFTANGVLYRGDLNFYTTIPGQEQLSIRVEDEVGGVINTGPVKGMDSKTVTINVTPVNDPPTIQFLPPSQIIEDTPVALPIQVNDAEIDSSAVWTVTLHADFGSFAVLAGLTGGVPTSGIDATDPSNVILTGTGMQIKTTLAAANGVIFQGVKDFAGTDILTVTIHDPGLAAGPTDDQTSAATLTYTISAVNDAPEITLPANLTTPEDVPLALTGLQGVSVDDVDSGAASISVVLQVFDGKLTFGGTVPNDLNVAGGGTNKVTMVGPVNAIRTVLSDPNGVRYQGNLNYFGTDTLSVTADDRGNTGAGGTQTSSMSTPITVTEVNDPPTVANPVADFSVDEDSPNTLIELFPGVFADPDNVTLMLTVPGNTNPTLVNAVVTGTRLMLTYLPNQSGMSTIRVQASDGTSSVEDEFVVTVRPMPDAPFVANPVPDQVVQLGSMTTVTVDLTGVFSDPDLPNDALTLSYNNATGNTNPILVTGGSLNQATSVLTLQLGAGQFGRADITVRATDLTSRAASETFTVIVNSLPTARGDSVTTKEDVQVGINVIANDSDVDGAIDPASVTLVAGSEPSHGQIVSISNGTVTYLPNANYSGPDSFRYTVKDNEGFESLPATVSITVQAVADYQNPALAADVNKSGQVTPIDALIVINYINSHPGGELPPDPAPPATPEFYYDVNGDGRCDAGDVLIIVNVLNGASLSAAEGESAATPLGSTPPSDTAPIADSSLSPRMFAIPDFTLLQRATGETAVATRRLSGDLPTELQRFEPIWPADANSKQDAWFEQSGGDATDLLEVALTDALDEIAGGVDAGFGESLAADLVLSGLKSRA
jgi:hypothetical protein